jgi:hypothetical protein
MPFYFRKSIGVGPFRFTLGRRSGSASVKVGPFRETLNTRGRRTTSVRLGDGLSWRKSNGGGRRRAR